MSSPGEKITFRPAASVSWASATPYAAASCRSKLAAIASMEGNAVAPWCPRTPLGPSA